MNTKQFITTVNPGSLGIKDFSNLQVSQLSEFLNAKMSLAAIALREQGLTWDEVAKKLGLNSKQSAQQMVKRYYENQEAK